ncbi:peroxynitrite isomerase THAP4-like isoform X2 [Bacillus rossius redtenbacheri]|uniref:peroxynitrite isomerase THAP4-like isoform X2 n=1 Tax=Bacillus rossius redtenbacheri TaxID=93214 RepID=UPI002FDD0C6D
MKSNYNRFPKNSEKCKLWVRALGRRKWQPRQTSFICSKHFVEEDFDRTSPFRIHLKSSAVPSVLLDLREDVKEEPDSETSTCAVGNAASLPPATDPAVSPATRRSDSVSAKVAASGAGADTSQEHNIAAFLADPLSEREAGPHGCVLCGRHAGPAGASRAPLCRRLAVLAGRAGLRPPPGSVLCARCAHLLSYADRLELELGLLRRTVADCVCATHHLCLPLPDARPVQITDSFPFTALNSLHETYCQVWARPIVLIG